MIDRQAVMAANEAATVQGLKSCRDIVARLDKELPVASVRTARDLVEAKLAQPKLSENGAGFLARVELPERSGAPNVMFLSGDAIRRYFYALDDSKAPQDQYALLGVSEAATPADLRRAWRLRQLESGVRDAKPAERVWAEREEKRYPALFGPDGEGIFPLGPETFAPFGEAGTPDPRWLTIGVFRFAPTPDRRPAGWVTFAGIVDGLPRRGVGPPCLCGSARLGYRGGSA